VDLRIDESNDLGDLFLITWCYFWWEGRVLLIAWEHRCALFYLFTIGVGLVICLVLLSFGYVGFLVVALFWVMACFSGGLLLMVEIWSLGPISYAYG